MKRFAMKRLTALLITLALLAAATCAAAEEDRPIVKIGIENAGDIYVELRPDAAPATVANFLALTDSGFYNGLTFHRIIAGFMMQGGDPLGNGTGGSPDRITGEFADNGFENPISHTRGVISMARSSDMNSASSQFFIVHADSPHLDGKYAAFGTVLAGMETVDRVCQSVRVADRNGTVLPSYQPRIISVARATREEAEAAAAAERANGIGGAPYTDPLTGLAVRLPEGWQLAKRLGGVATFTDGAREIMMNSQDLWAYSYGLYCGDTNEGGMNRADLNTGALTKEAMVGALGVTDTDAFAAEEHSGATWYVGTVQTSGGGVRIAIGLADGLLVAFQCGEDASEALNAVLDGIDLHPGAQTTK